MEHKPMCHFTPMIVSEYANMHGEDVCLESGYDWVDFATFECKHCTHRKYIDKRGELLPVPTDI